MTPRILFNDKNLTRTDNDLLSLIISLALKNDYCFASNNYLADYIETSIRTISASLSKLKRLGYIKARNVNGNRRIYLNSEKIPTKVASEVEENCSNIIVTDCDHNINSDYKREYKTRKFKKEGIVPIWMKHPELCVSEEPTEEEKKEMDKDLADIQEKISRL